AKYPRYVAHYLLVIFTYRIYGRHFKKEKLFLDLRINTDHINFKIIKRTLICRGYYRCTHRNVQGCLATKQVQRSDEDPTIFDITYRGRHTCAQATSHFAPPPQPQENQEPIIETQQIHHQTHQENNPAPQPQQQSQELLFNFRRELKVITEDLEDSDLHD